MHSTHNVAGLSPAIAADDAIGAVSERPIAASIRPWLARLTMYSSIFLVWIFAIFCFTAGRGDPQWLAHWDRWDAGSYRQIWVEGYRPDLRTLAFPPGYPYLEGGIAKLFSTSFLSTAIALNLIALFSAAVLISEWLSRKFSVSPYVLFAFVLSAPASYFAFTSYSDVVFMLLLWILLCLTLAPRQPSRTRTLIVQASLLFLLPWVRLSGYALASWLFARRLAALAVIGSLALWLGFNWKIAGSPFYFLRAQQIFAMPPGNFFQGLATSLQTLFSSDLANGYAIPWLQFAFLPLFYLIALAAVAIWLGKRGEGLLAITIISILLISHNQADWRSVVRYDLPIAPVLCLPLLANLKSRATSQWFQASFYALLTAQFALQFIFARQFHSGAWGF